MHLSRVCGWVASGFVASDYLAFRPSYKFGIPTLWIGEKIFSRWYPHRNFTPPHPNDPPVFESEAAYLKRLDLFVKGERSRLDSREFQPCNLHTRGIYMNDETAIHPSTRSATASRTSFASSAATKSCCAKVEAWNTDLSAFARIIQPA